MPAPDCQVDAQSADTAIYAVTQVGAQLGRVLARELGGELFVSERLADAFGVLSFKSLVPFVAVNFTRYSKHVFITAAGIAVRSIAPLLRGKDRDPAVVAVDQRGRYAISLVSGHLGGANDLARSVAAITAGHAVVTTATDTEDLPSLDTMAQECGLAIANLGAVKHANLALLAGEKVQVFDPENWLRLRTQRACSVPVLAEHFILLESAEQWAAGAPGVFVTHEVKKPQEKMLVLNPPCLVVGVGCRRGVPVDEILAFIRQVLCENNLAEASIIGLASITAKQDEQGLLDAACELGVGLFFYEPEELSAVTVPNPSERVVERMGVPSVCEAAAILQSGAQKLLVQKQKNGKVTVAVAMVP